MQTLISELVPKLLSVGEIQKGIAESFGRRNFDPGSGYYL